MMMMMMMIHIKVKNKFGLLNKKVGKTNTIVQQFSELFFKCHFAKLQIRLFKNDNLSVAQLFLFDRRIIDQINNIRRTNTPLQR